MCFLILCKKQAAIAAYYAALTYPVRAAKISIATMGAPAAFKLPHAAVFSAMAHQRYNNGATAQFLCVSLLYKAY